jgi:small subunit ribosomal protein S4
MNLRGPKAKISRRLGIAVTQKVQKILDRRTFPPGQHGPTTRNPEPKSVYGKQLREKQRLRAQYNVSEKQLRGYFQKAVRSNQPTGEALVATLESRLDAVIYRAGFARSVFAARQYAAHGHFEVNGRRVSIPSMMLRAGDVVQLRQKSRECATFQDPRLEQQTVPEHLLVDRPEFKVTVLRKASASEAPIVCNISMVVEFYSR